MFPPVGPPILQLRQIRINARLDGAVALLTWNRKRQGPRMTLMSFAAFHPLTRVPSSPLRRTPGSSRASTASSQAAAKASLEVGVVCCDALVRFWHKADIPRCLLFVGFRGRSGHAPIIKFGMSRRQLLRAQSPSRCAYTRTRSGGLSFWFIGGDNTSLQDRSGSLANG